MQTIGSIAKLRSRFCLRRMRSILSDSSIWPPTISLVLSVRSLAVWSAYCGGCRRKGLIYAGRDLEPPVADPGKLHLLQPPNPFCREPPAVVTDALIVHPHPQAVESALIGRHPPVAVLLMERMQFGQPLRPHSVLLGLTLPLHIPDKTDFIESAQLLTAQTACPNQSAH